MNHPEIHVESPLSILNFTVMDDAALESVRKNLGLTMSAAEFRACRNYYKNTLRRDPQIEELFLLDGLVASTSHAPDYLCLAEMKTDSPLIAEIFADLMARRRAVVTDAERPSSLTDLIGIMGNYLSATAKKEHPFSNISVCFTPHRDLLLACEGYRLTASTGNGDGDIAVGVAAKSAMLGTAAKNGDYVFAILNTRNGGEDFESRLAAFLCEETVRGVCKKAVPLCERGMLQGLLQSADGMTLNTAALLGEADTLSTLTEPLLGVLITASPAASADMLLLADEMGLHVIRAATVTAGSEIRISTKNGTVSFRSSFLRGLTLPRVYSTAVPVPTATSPEVTLARIGTCTLNGHKHSVVKTDATGNEPFASALYGVLYSFLCCFAAGANLSEVGMACHLKLPRPSASRMGEALSSILGLYRMQAELELYGNAPTVEQGDGEHPTLSIATIAPLPLRTVPSAAVGGGTKIFYLEPLYQENGIPDFDDLKKMLEYVTALNKDGHVLSMMPASGDLLTDLQKMSRNTTVEYMYDDPIPSRLGGLLIETDMTIQGTVVAKTEPLPLPTSDASSNEVSQGE